MNINEAKPGSSVMEVSPRSTVAETPLHSDHDDDVLQARNYDSVRLSSADNDEPVQHALILCYPSNQHDKQLGKNPTWVELGFSPLADTLTFITFVLFGTAAVTFWSTIVTTLPSAQQHLYKEHQDISDTATLASGGSTVIMLAILLYFDLFHMNFFLVGVGGFVLGGLGLCLTYQLAEGSVGVALTHLCFTIGGISSVLFEIVLWFHASILPENYQGANSVGNGCSGLYSFLAWLLLSKVIFSQTPSGTKASVWVLVVGGAALNNCVAALLFVILKRQPWAAECLRVAEVAKRERKIAKTEAAKAKKLAKIEGAILMSTSDPKIRFSLDVFKDAAEQILNVSFAHWLTLGLFPNIAPLAWNRTVLEKDLLMGIVFIAEFAGRYIPNLRQWIPCVVVSPKNVKYVGLSRILFIPLFLVMFRVPDNKLGILSTFWFQAMMITLFALSMGWLTTLSSIYTTDCVEDPDEKGDVGTWLYIGVVLGACMGVGMAKIWKLGHSKIVSGTV